MTGETPRADGAPIEVALWSERGVLIELLEFPAPLPAVLREQGGRRRAFHRGVHDGLRTHYFAHPES